MSGFELPLPLLPAIVVAIGAWLVAAGWEWRRKARGAGIRLLLLAVAVIALLGLYLRPLRTVPRSETAYLLTDGWREALGQADAALQPGIPVWSPPGLAPPREPGPSPSPARVAPLSRLAAVAGSLRIVGHGLEPDELDEVGVPVSLAVAAPEVAGVAAIRWRRRLERGEALSVRGRLAGLSADTRLELVGPGGVEDEARPGPGGDFLLRGMPRAEGLSLWKVRIETPGEPAREERLEVAVVPPAPFALLWLEDSPSFETGSVRRWLTGLGRAVAVRSRVSRERYRSELDNLPPLDLSRVTPELLGNFDLLVADPGTVARWSTSERAAVRDAVEEGLGLLLLARSEGSLEAVQRLAGVAVEAETDAEPWLLRLRLPDLIETPVLELAPRRLRVEGGARPLISDRAGRILATVRPQGAGAVGLSLVTDTYRWVLRGEGEAHRAFWAALIAELGRPRRPDGSWRMAAGPAWVDRPLAVTLATELSEASEAVSPEAGWIGPSGDTYSLALRQGSWAPELWDGAVVPREEGWHQLRGGGATAWFYAQPAASWAALRAAGRQAATRRGELLGPVAPAEEQAPLPTPARGARVSLLLLAVGALGALWWDPWSSLGGRSSDSPPAARAASD